MRRRGPYDTAAAWVHGRWFFAQDRVEQIGHRLDELGWTAAAMTPTRVEFFFSFRSPYSYLAAPRAFALPERFDVDLAYRGVIPMAMRGQAVPRAKRLHTLRDVDREAARLGLPFGRIHDPIGAGAERCLLVAEHAVDVGRERELRARGEPRDLGRGGRRRARRRAAGASPSGPGLEWDACRAALEDPALRARVDASTARLDELGHWGVPVLVHGGELFWGQDHVEDLEAVLREDGPGALMAAPHRPPNLVLRRHRPGARPAALAGGARLAGRAHAQRRRAAADRHDVHERVHRDGDVLARRAPACSPAPTRRGTG